MHHNEIKVDQTNMEALMQEAETLGPAHVAALKEQIERQTEVK